MPGKRRSTPKQREAAANRQAEELDNLHSRLADTVEELTHTGAWRDWLNVAARFHTYSVNNTMLILMQKPQATLVAGYTDWQKMGRQVRKGEGGQNSIRILAPVKRRVPARGDNTDQAQDGTDTTEQDARDSARTEVRTVGFKPTSVFDVSQTDGDPLPERPRPELLQGRAPDGLWQALESFAVARGWDVSREPITGGSNGYTDYTMRNIRVRDDVEPAQAVKTLAHEVGHALLHADDNSGVNTHRGIAEVEAESVAHLVLAAHGADTDSYTFDYVTGWANQVPGQEPGDTVRATAERVLNTSRTILGETLDAPLEPEQARAQRGRAHHAAAETTALADRAELRSGAAVGGDRSEQTRSSTVGRPSRASWISSEPELVTAPDQLQRHAAANATAAEFYRKQLHATPHARDYLVTRVGDLDTLPDGVRMGYAPSEWTALLDHLRAEGHDDRDLLEAGLVQQSRHGNLIDRFRDRVTVAIHNQDGEVAGFIGRPPHEGFDPERTPKYLNTQASELFDKGALLFGAHEHRDALAGGAVPVLCEGPLDALALSNADAGTQQIAPVATSGTAVTPTHLLTVHEAAASDRLVLALDSDSAGQAAAARAADLALDLPREVTTVALPDGHDPASWVASHTTAAAALQPYLDHAQQTPAVQLLVDHRIEEYFSHHPAQHRDEVEGQVGALQAAVPVLTRVDDTTATQQGVRLATQLRLDPGTVATAMADSRTADGEATKRVHDRADTARGRDRGVNNVATPSRRATEQPRPQQPTPARSLRR